MSRDQLVDQFEATNKRKDSPEFKVGDTVKVSTKIVEGLKERIQVFTGVVIARKGIGTSETFTVYRTAYGSCMERVFLIHSPRVMNVEVVRFGDVSRAKLYHIRGHSGKKAKIKEKIGGVSKKIKAVANKKEISEEVTVDNTKVEKEES